MLGCSRAVTRRSSSFAASLLLPVFFTSFASSLERRAAAFPQAPSAPVSNADSTVTAGPSIGGVIVTSSTTYDLQQRVVLQDVPADAKRVAIWVPIPSDGAWQRVLDRRIIEAPPGTTLVRQDDPRGDMLVVKLDEQALAQARKGAVGSGPLAIAVAIGCTLVREAPAVDLQGRRTGASPSIDAALFAEELAIDAPLMAVSPEVQAMADEACKGVADPVERVLRLLEAVADRADHYSKDPTKPHCGRGAAEDCLAQGGGCCTDLHALFIALARSQGIPARLQFGYRLTPANEGKADVDPGYRCWVEFHLAGLGWVPTDIVVADSGEREARKTRWGTLDDRRVWLWEGRGHTLDPAQTGPPIQTMIVGYAEIDGQPVDPLPAADGTPSKLARRISFSVVERSGATTTVAPRTPAVGAHHQPAVERMRHDTDIAALTDARDRAPLGAR
jgi:transglutaminase-like putative cysteine protease